MHVTLLNVVIWQKIAGLYMSLVTILIALCMTYHAASQAILF